MRSRWGWVGWLGLAAAVSVPVAVRGRAQVQLAPESQTETKAGPKAENAKGDRNPHGTFFRTSDRCVACHNGLLTKEGEDVSIGMAWRASIMANASRDPYWQASLRREAMDHPESKQAVENDCSLCHMPAVRMPERDAVKDTHVFSRLPLHEFPKGDAAAADGVTCTVCHQIDAAGLGSENSFSGKVRFSPAIGRDLRAEYGPFDPDNGHQTVMHSSTATYRPQKGDQMRDAALCGSCHTLYTDALGPHGEKVGTLPEQVPYQEWQHSTYNNTKQTCQYCHMPEVSEPVAITAVYGEPRQGLHRHVFVGGDFIMEGMLNEHRDDLKTAALPEELDAAMKRTTEFLQTQSSRVTVGAVETTASGIAVDVHVENLGGHKLPTAYPSRRAWLHVVLKDAGGRVIFESGALKPDGSIVGNDNDEDPTRFEPHYREITRADQVEIYEPILGDLNNRVTTGLLTAVKYLKDNRLLPHGFDKATAGREIAVVGEAKDDPAFNDRGDTVRYAVRTGAAAGPFTVEAELMYQPIGFRWAHNLEPYKAEEPQRMVKYYEQAAGKSALVLAKASR
ncbi:MAG: hypothetical protein M3O02_01565 [Acidobacteriota bacterium]|nr:hypothetical protein [Acidobacteriota bacterium]